MKLFYSLEMTSNNVTHLHRPVELTEYDVWMDDNKVYRYQTNNKPVTGNLTVYRDDEQTQPGFKTGLLGGLRHGMTELFHDNGVLEESAFYLNGNKTGLQKILMRKVA